MNTSPKYILKKPVEAKQLTEDNIEEVTNWVDENGGLLEYKPCPEVFENTWFCLSMGKREEFVTFGQYIVCFYWGHFVKFRKHEFERDFDNLPVENTTE